MCGCVELEYVFYARRVQSISNHTLINCIIPLLLLVIHKSSPTLCLLISSYFSHYLFSVQFHQFLRVKFFWNTHVKSVNVLRTQPPFRYAPFSIFFSLFQNELFNFDMN